MLFRQLIDLETSSYTYLLSAGPRREAVLIDPVKSQLQTYLTLLRELELTLVKTLDTHTHADHITALGDLRDATGAASVMGEQSRASCVSERVADGQTVEVDELVLRALSTPGHTNESYSFLLERGGPPMVFTGDVLLIRGSGRTDFQGGDPHASYRSIVHRLFTLPEQTLVYPAHDYKGWTASSIGEEKRHNPRLAGKSEAEYVAIMQALNPPDPKQIDVAVPANLACGQPAA